MTLSSRLPTRGRVAAAALVLPLLAVAGCAGATQAERASVQDDLQAAQSALQSSKAASFTLHLEDPQGTLKKAMTSGAADSAVPGATADALVGGSVSWTVDPVGTSTLADVQKADKAAPLGQQLSRSNLALRVDAGGGAVAQLRLVDGVAYLNDDE